MKAAAIRLPVHLALVTALVAAGAVVLLSGPAPAGASTGSGSETSTDPGSTETTTTTLTHDSPHVSTSHDAGSGGWTFVVEGNKHVVSVRITVAENDCATGGETLWETKVTDDELESGSVAREVAFAEGWHCSHLLLDGNTKATATVTTTVPVRPCASPTAETSPTPEASPSESATPEASISPTADVSPSPSPDPCDNSHDPYTSAEYERCSDGTDEKDPHDQDVDHRVLAGATGPDPDKPFLYQKFYPSTLQVHQGDLVEWCHNASYDWHTVSFLPTDMDVALHPESDTDNRPFVWRWDETGHKAFDESMVFGHGRGDESKECGLGPFFHLTADDPCELSSTDNEVSSSLWDQFFSLVTTDTFRIKIDLQPGLYRYHCKIHTSMEGYIEVLPQDQALANPSHGEVDAEIAADYAEANRVFEELSDPSNAYDYKKQRWVVRVGTETADRSVAIEQFLPARIDVREGDTVHYVAETDEPNSVTFPGGRQFEGMTLPTGHRIDGKYTDPQGGFSATGECDMHSCTGDIAAPWGMVGLAFVWKCDDDGRAVGAPGTLPYVPVATVERMQDTPANSHGCIQGGLPEIVSQPWYSDQQRAPGDLVVSEKTFHNSGTILAPTLPDWYRTVPAAGPFPAATFPDTFDAKFPNEGTFKYFCAAHEFMNGVVNVTGRTR